MQSISKACAARRATGGQRKILRVSYPLRFHARITPLLPHIGKRNSLPLRRRAGEGELPRRGKRDRPGPRPQPAADRYGAFPRPKGLETITPCIPFFHTFLWIPSGCLVEKHPSPNFGEKLTVFSTSGVEAQSLAISRFFRSFNNFFPYDSFS